MLKNIVARPIGRFIQTRLAASSAIKSGGNVTHTGQSFDENDYRNIRFSLSNKQVNPNFSEKLISEIAPIEVETRIASCDGGGGALGHPKVYINLDQPGNHTCGYCGLRFVQKHH
ncbi:NADH dehydrogenase Fe-S protein subunit 6 ndufs6 [Cichlidogyrus casuarinus]|uniref:NADH dehydrogenase [ubiquinone] iron-sulfur protein 6, mitochondrial n=1 Tax=Cichlidogyrus casuarinus TaxID=1844966 RepID=A0ABD2PX06_9PLAT